MKKFGYLISGKLPLLTFNDLSQPQMTLNSRMVLNNIMYITLPFQKYITCMGCLRYEKWPLLTFNVLSRPQMTLNYKKVFKMLMYITLPFQKYITCLSYVWYEIWPLLTFNDLARPQVTFLTQIIFIQHQLYLQGLKKSIYDCNHVCKVSTFPEKRYSCF